MLYVGGGYWDVVISEENDQIIGTQAYFVKRRYGFEYITQPPITQHNGMWIRESKSDKNEKKLSDQNKVIKDLISQIENIGLSYFQQNFSPTFTNYIPLLWSGYRQRTLYSFVIQSSKMKMEDIEKNFSKVIRYDIKNAREAFTIEESSNLDLFYSLHKSTFARQGKAPSCSRELLQKIDEACRKHDACRMILTRDSDGNYYSGAYYVKDAMKVYYVLSGTDMNTRNTNSLAFLLYEGIKYANELGLDFDFEGSVVEKIYEYFRKFGGEQVPYFNIRKIYSKNPAINFMISKKLK